MTDAPSGAIGDPAEGVERDAAAGTGPDAAEGVEGDARENGGPDAAGPPGEAPAPAPAPAKRKRTRPRHRRHKAPEEQRSGEPAPPAGPAGEDTAIREKAAGPPGSSTTVEGAEQAGAQGAHVPIERPAPKTYGPLQAAFFDLDKTVIAKASMVAFGRPFYHGGLINRRTVLRAVYGQLIYLHLGASEQRLDRIRESVLRLTRGWNRDRVCEIVEEAIEEIVEPIIFADAADLIDRHHEEGRIVVIVSASPDEIVAPLSKFLGADAHIASRSRVDEDGRYTGSMDFYAYGPFKAEAIDELAIARGVDLAASFAYSDSYTDLPMLEIVGHPVAVNPDRVLGRYAREHDFEVLHFSQTVGLWSRVRDRIGSVPPRPAIAMSAGAAAIGAGAAAAGWWLGSRRREDD